MPALPPPRHRAAAVVSALLGLLVLAGCSGGGSVAAPGRQIGTRLDSPVPARIARLPLTDSTGHVRHLADFRGKVLVISDSMTLCQEACPLDTAQLVQTAREVERAGHGKDVAFLSITVDPERDTARQLAAYRRLFHAAPANWTLLTGSPADVHALWKWFGVYWHKVPQHDRPRPRSWRTGQPLTYDVAHSDEVFFLLGGHERFVIEGMPHLASGSMIPRRLHRFMSSEGRHNIAHPHPYAWTVPQALHVVRWLLSRRGQPSAG